MIERPLIGRPISSGQLSRNKSASPGQLHLYKEAVVVAPGSELLSPALGQVRSFLDPLERDLEHLDSFREAHNT